MFVVSEWSDAQEAPSKKSTTASIDRHPRRDPESVTRQHRHVSSPSPAAAFYASSQASPRARERVRVSIPSATTTLASSMSSQASPQARRDRVSNPSAATAPELVVAQGLHDTLIQRLTEDLQRAALLVFVGVTPKKARAQVQKKYCSCDRPPHRSDSESAPRRHLHPLWLRHRPRPRLPALQLPPRVRVSVALPSPATASSASSLASPQARGRARVSTPSAAST